jgi:hypothetical protein
MGGMCFYEIQHNTTWSAKMVNNPVIETQFQTMNLLLDTQYSNCIGFQNKIACFFEI